jgi:hypothetical protein
LSGARRASQAWVIALYAETYGLPLTMYLPAGFLGRSENELTQNHFLGHLWPLLFGADDLKWMILCDVVGNTLIVIGSVLAILGWRKIHGSAGKLVDDGIYRYIRHPQYAGFYLLLIGGHGQLRSSIRELPANVVPSTGREITLRRRRLESCTNPSDRKDHVLQIRRWKLQRIY